MAYGTGARRYAPKRKTYTARKNYRAKKPYAKRSKPSTGLANQVKRVLNRQVEKKYVDYALSGSVPMIEGNQLLPNSSMLVWSLCDMSQGTGRASRVGNYISPVAIDLKITFPSNIPPHTMVKINLVKVNTDNFMPTGDTIANVSGEWRFNTPERSNLQDQLSIRPEPFDGVTYHLAADKVINVKRTWTLTAQGPPPQRFLQKNIHIPLSGKLKFSSAGGTLIPDQSYYLVMRTHNPKVLAGQYIRNDGRANTVPDGDVTAAAFSIHSRFVYTDL
jgi:hypothetical protein